MCTSAVVFSTTAILRRFESDHPLRAPRATLAMGKIDVICKDFESSNIPPADALISMPHANELGRAKCDSIDGGPGYEFPLNRSSAINIGCMALICTRSRRGMATRTCNCPHSINNAHASDASDGVPSKVFVAASIIIAAPSCSNAKFPLQVYPDRLRRIVLLAQAPWLSCYAWDQPRSCVQSGAPAHDHLHWSALENLTMFNEFWAPTASHLILQCCDVYQSQRSCPAVSATL